MDPALTARPTSHARAVEWASHWAQHWFIDDHGADRFAIGDIEAGWATHVEAYLLLYDVANEHLGGQASRKPMSLRAWTKRQGLDRAVRRAMLRRFRPDPVAAGDLAAIVEIPTPSMCEPAALVALAANDPWMIATADPRVPARVRGHGLSPARLVESWEEERHALRRGSAMLGPAWRAFQSQPPKMPLGSVDLARWALPALAPLAQRSMPYLVAEALAISRFLDRRRPITVAIASDQHRIGRLTVAECRRRGIRTVVLQHGLPQAPIGYVPVVADMVAAWSDAAREWFMERGAPADAVVVTGSPRADSLRALKEPLGDRPRVLLALSPTDPATNAKVVSTVLESTEALGDASLTIKLHPGQGDWSFLRAMMRERPAGREAIVLQHEPLEAALADASVVVLHRSSVAIEALAAGRPVVIADVGNERSGADLELRSLHLPVVDRADLLAQVIRQLSLPQEARRYFSDREPVLRHHIGPVGGSAGRVVDLMRQVGTT